MSSERTTISLLQAEPELGEGLNPQERPACERVLAVPVRGLDPGPWDPIDEFAEMPPVVGLMVLDGLITRDVVFAGRTTTELLGGGDLLRPWDDDLQFDPLPFSVSWRVHVPASIAILDTRVAMAAGRWPTLAAAL